MIQRALRMPWVRLAPTLFVGWLAGTLTFAAGSPEVSPACEQVSGTNSITFSLDDGLTVAPTPGPEGISYTGELVPVPGTDRMFAAVDRRILVSYDRGCQWSLVAELPPGPQLLRLAVAATGDLFTWTPLAGELFRVTESGVVVALPSPVNSRTAGFALDRSDPPLLRVADSKGSIWTSADAGDSWSQTGSVPLSDQARSLYDAAFAPHDLDHIVVGTTLQGALVSRDGGRRWKRSGGFAARRGPGANVFRLVFSPVSDDIVWAMAIDLSKLRDERHIYRSRDGGQSFAPVLGEASGAFIVNGPLMVAHPTRPKVLYFEFGLRVYGTNLYRFDVATGRLATRRLPFDGVSSIAFSTDGEVVMYLGLVSENRQEPQTP